MANKLHYYVYGFKNQETGTGDNEHTDAQAQSVMLQYDINHKATVKTGMGTVKIPVPYTGCFNRHMFAADQTSYRSRNCFSPIFIPSLVINWQPSLKTKIQLTASAVLEQETV